MNPNLGASARTLQDWILLGHAESIQSSVALRNDGDLRRWLAAENVPHRLSPMVWPDRADLVRSLWQAWQLRRWMNQLGSNYIHCYEHDLYPFAALLRSITSFPLVCHIHFAVGRDFAAWAFGGPRKRPDAVIWTSHRQRADSSAALEGLVSDECQHVIPLGVDLRRFGTQSAARQEFRSRFGLSPSDIVISAACALRARKRVDDFVALVRAIHERYPQVVGVLAGGEVPGDEAYAQEIIPRLRSAEQNGGFKWLGNLEPIEPLLQGSDIFVSTSEYETFGMSVLESMACAKTVVAYEGGSIGEVVADAGAIVPTGDLNALIEVTEALVTNAARRHELGEAARRRVSTEFNPENSLKQLVRIYASLKRPE
jgi:glycosyltransferase involved in cell wall biosynthesis